MTDYLILAEKPSAAKKFATALGGTTGSYGGKSYKIVASHGHLMTLKEPTEMLKDASLAKKYKSWDVSDLPWDMQDFTWQKTYIKSYNPRTKKKQSTAADIKKIKEATKDIQTLVIATDDDPSGEGQLLGWEIVNAIGWHGPVGRMYFEDESARSVQKAFNQIVELPAQNQDGEYLKAETRNRWDYMSMQLTRASTDLARKAGYHVKSVRQGRLKSVIVRHVFDQHEAIKNYQRKPFYEVKFKDENEHVFTNKLKDTPKFEQKNEGEQELQKYHDSAINSAVTTRKMQSPGALIDLSGLAARLAPMGFNAKEVLATYQKLYEAEYVSYPRTEDKKITLEQFNDLLSLAEQIATVVGVNPQLLTHRSPRKKHLTKDAAHGANRPGLKVPTSLADLSKYGPSAQAIYQTLAKNYLAILCEDYVYDQVKATLVDYPTFETSFNVPIELNFKQVFANDSDEQDQEQTAELGKTASPFLYEGANPKPTKPSLKWVTKYLEKYNVGTGATRTSTLAELVVGTNAPLKEKKGVYSMTPVGNLTAALNKDTWISSVNVTEKLFNGMAQVGQKQIKPGQLLGTVTQTIEHDVPIMIDNAKSLATTVGKPQGNTAPFKKKEKVSGTLANGTKVEFNQRWGTHTFTDKEVNDLLAGKEISFKYKRSTIKGSLQQQTYKGHKFWGFKKI